MRTARSSIILLLIALSGCATGAKRTAMVYAGENPQGALFDPALRSAVTVVSVTGGRNTHPLWMSRISNEAFKGALQDSLAVHGLNAQMDGRFRLDAEIVGLDQPILAFDMTVTSRIHYHLTDMVLNAVALDRVYSVAYVAALRDSLYGVTRLRLANEGSARENIAAFFRDLAMIKVPPSNAPGPAMVGGE